MKKVPSFLHGFVTKFLACGISAEEDLGLRSRVIFLNSVTIAGAVLMAFFAAISLESANHALTVAGSVSASVVALNFVFFRLTRRYWLGGLVDCLIVFVFYYYLAYTGGEAGSGIFWSMTFPPIVLFLLGPAAGSALALAYLAAVAVTIFTPSLNNAHFPALYSARVVGTYLFIWVFALIYENVSRRSQAKLVAANGSLRKVTDELVTEKKQTDDILGHVEEGIFLLSPDLRIGEAYSAHLETILERKGLKGEHFIDLVSASLSPKDREGAADYFKLFLSGTVNEDLLAEINPLSDADVTLVSPEGNASFKRLRFAFTRIASYASPYPILGVVSDATAAHELNKRLAEEEKEHRRDMEGLFQVIHVDPVMMREFIADTESELETVNELMRSEGSSGKEVLESLFQSAHAIKGNAALLGLTEFSTKVHAFEGSVKSKLETGHEWRDLLELTLGLAEISRELETLKSLIDKVLSFQIATKSAGLADSSLLRYSIEKIVKRESERSGTPAAVDFDGFGRRSVPDEYRKLVKDVLIQLVRNSFAHGFESAAERAGSGKEATGKIKLKLEWSDQALCLRYSDDGRGLDSEAIRAKARSLPGLSEAADAMSPGDLAKLIFRPGFSTAAETNMSAGRGVGMALVKNRVGDAGGKLAVRSSPGKYLEFVITLPLPMSAQAVS